MSGSSTKSAKTIAKKIIIYTDVAEFSTYRDIPHITAKVQKHLAKFYLHKDITVVFPVPLQQFFSFAKAQDCALVTVESESGKSILGLPYNKGCSALYSLAITKCEYTVDLFILIIC